MISVNSLVFYIISILIWILTLVNSSGFGLSIHSWDKTIMLFGACTAFIFIFGKERFFRPNPKTLIAILLIFITTFALPFLCGFNVSQCSSYYSVFLITFVVSNIPYSDKNLQNVGLSVAILGILTLYIYLNMEILSGWNDNTIGMTGLFSFMIYAITIYNNKNTSQWLVSIVITIIYIILIWQTENRSSQLFMVLMIVFIVCQNKVYKYLQKPKTLFWALQLPLIIAIVITFLGLSSYFTSMDEWSQEEFNKGVFNDRNELWYTGLKTVWGNWGNGTYLFEYNYHNSAIAAICVFGIWGYIAWINLFYQLLKSVVPYLKDPMIYGSLCAFLMIYIQQSFDLGFINTESNLLPYYILGLMLSRRNQLMANSL